MLIKYGQHVINMNQVTDFVCTGMISIKFFYAFIDPKENDQVFIEFSFGSEEEREEAFEKINEYYFNEVRLCVLG